MENASKALIIAGAILLSILIISLGIVIWRQAADVINSTSMSDMEKETFNAKFEQYQGESVRGANVNALLQQMITSNSDELNIAANRKVTLLSTTAKGVNDEVIALGGENESNDQISVRAKTSKVYKVKCNYTKGLVSSVTITE